MGERGRRTDYSPIRYWKGRRDETRGRRRRPRPIGRDARLHLGPGYNNGNAPYGVFNWADTRVPTSWINNGDIPSDICLTLPAIR